LGITYKENCPDIRNSKAIKLIELLNAYGITPIVTDPQASANDVKQESGVELVPFESLHGLDCAIFAIAHDEYINMPLEKLNALFGDYPNCEKVIIDVKAALNKDKILQKDYRYWRL